MEYQTETILTPSLQEFCEEIERLVREGYQIDPALAPSETGTAYEVGMRKQVVSADDEVDYDFLRVPTATAPVEQFATLPDEDLENPEVIEQPTEKPVNKGGRPRKNK